MQFLLPDFFFYTKNLYDQIWKWTKIGQGQPRVIIWINCSEKQFILLHMKFWYCHPIGWRYFLMFQHGCHYNLMDPVTYSTYQVSWQSAYVFWMRVLKIFYYSCTWQPSWWCILIPANKLLFPHFILAPYDFCLHQTHWFLRHLKILTFINDIQFLIMNHQVKLKKYTSGEPD